MGNGEWGVGNREWGVEKGEWGMGNGEEGMGKREEWLKSRGRKAKVFLFGESNIIGMANQWKCETMSQSR